MAAVVIVTYGRRASRFGAAARELPSQLSAWFSVRNRRAPRARAAVVVLGVDGRRCRPVWRMTFFLMPQRLCCARPGRWAAGGDPLAMTGTCSSCPLARRRSPLVWRASCCRRRRRDVRQLDATPYAAVLMCARSMPNTNRSSLRQPLGCFFGASARRPLLVARCARASCCRCRPLSSFKEDAHTAVWSFARGTRGSSSACPSRGARAVFLAPPRHLLVARGASCFRRRRRDARQLDAMPYVAVLLCAKNSRFLKRSR